jgi:hypothetical protein
MSKHNLGYHQLDALAEGRTGEVDVTCPLCATPGTYKRSRKKLRLWVQPGFIGFHCAKCRASGYVKDDDTKVTDINAIRRIRAEAAERTRRRDAERLAIARSLWSRRGPLEGTIAERYLSEARFGYNGPLPGTLFFLPAHGRHEPAVIAGFGIPDETESGWLLLPDDRLRGIHLTKLKQDGSGKADVDSPKIMIGHSAGWPIVLAPPNDLLGLVIGEGIEKVLAAALATGVGGWVAGSASRLPALTDKVPSWIDFVSILVDENETGRKNSEELARQLECRRIATRLIQPGRYVQRAA